MSDVRHRGKPLILSSQEARRAGELQQARPLLREDPTLGSCHVRGDEKSPQGEAIERGTTEETSRNGKTPETSVQRLRRSVPKPG